MFRVKKQKQRAEAKKQGASAPPSRGGHGHPAAQPVLLWRRANVQPFRAYPGWGCPAPICPTRFAPPGLPHPVCPVLIALVSFRIHRPASGIYLATVRKGFLQGGPHPSPRGGGERRYHYCPARLVLS
jgi:hypothetical protein